MPSTHPAWPELDWPQWKDTAATLQLWTQVVGKVRLERTPWLNHSWHVTLHLSARGLTTTPVWWGERAAELEFDFIDHALVIRTDDGARRDIPLKPQSVAAFHAAVMAALEDLGLPVAINDLPSEVADPVPFPQDTARRSYDADAAQRFWRALVQADRVFKRFRTGFLGKSSPSHFFWGSFDLAVTRFSGRRAPLHPGGVPGLPDDVTQEAYSHQEASAGFWPGGGPVDHAAFYAYAYPAPDGFADAKVRPAQAYFHKEAGEFILPYDAVRAAADPDAVLLDFLQSTYEAAADLGGWDRAELECPLGVPGRVRPLNPG